MSVFLANILSLILIILLVLILVNFIFNKKDKVVSDEKTVNKKFDIKKLDFKKILFGIIISILLCPVYYFGVFIILSIILGFIYGFESGGWAIAMIISAAGSPILAIITAIKILSK